MFVSWLVFGFVVAISFSRADSGLRRILLCSAAVTGAQMFAFFSQFAGESVYAGSLFVDGLLGGILANAIAMLLAIMMRLNDLARVFRFGMLFVIGHWFTTGSFAYNLYGVGHYH